MRNGQLFATLCAFAEEAAERLAGETAGGAEMPFELVEERAARRPILYCYRPLVGDFVRDRFDGLSGLATYAPALRALKRLNGLEGYLTTRGETAAGAGTAEAALRVFLAAAVGETDTFEILPQRLRAAYVELESAAYDGRMVSTVVAPVLGLSLESEEVVLGDGFSLARGEVMEGAPPEAVWGLAREAERPAVLAVHRAEDQPHGGAARAAAGARIRLRRLLTALRLFDGAPLALGPVAFARCDEGPWRMAGLGLLGAAEAPGSLLVRADQEDELRAFISLVTRRTPRGGELAWALRRFELALEQAEPADALSDHLLALRALLEPEGPRSGRLPQRLAAICALERDRPALAEWAAAACALERSVVAGLAHSPGELSLIVEELARHCRALLRDVLCGHLDHDLCGVADRLLAEAVAA